jgi:hypothetical protein
MRTAFRATLLTFSRPFPKGVCAIIITPMHSRIVDNIVLFIVLIVDLRCKGSANRTKYQRNKHFSLYF